LLYSYQLDFVTPGIIPFNASVLKHILQRPNFLKTPFGLPQSPHLVYALTLNFGVLFCFAIKLFFAIKRFL